MVRDNHIGDWGTNFGTLIMKIKRDGIDLSALGDDALITLDQLYKDGSALELEQPELRAISRNELVLLQQGDQVNTAIWEQIVEISKIAFEKLFVQMGVEVDITLGESFYRDKVQRVYDELTQIGLAEESDGALVVWHDEVKNSLETMSAPTRSTFAKATVPVTTPPLTWRPCFTGSKNLRPTRSSISLTLVSRITFNNCFSPQKNGLKQRAMHSL